MRFIWLLLLFISCVSTPTPESTFPSHPDPRFKAEMRFSADDVPYTGTALLPRRVTTKFAFVLPKETYLFLLNTCGRELNYWNPDSNKPFGFTYNPAFDVENEKDGCQLIATAITKTGELHRAVVDFTNSTGSDLPGKLFCNGEWIPVSGAGFCQTRSTIEVHMKFDVETVYGTDLNTCPPPEERDLGKHYIVKAAPGFCVYWFYDQQHRAMRLTTLGYTSILGVFPAKGK